MEQENSFYEPDRYEHILKHLSKRNGLNIPGTETYRQKLKGALFGGLAGGTLATPVRGWESEKITELAGNSGDNFTGGNYWNSLPDPEKFICETNPAKEYTQDGMDGVPANIFAENTLLNLLITEEHGISFTTENAAASWLKYIPNFSGVSQIPLKNLREKVSPYEAGGMNNPDLESAGILCRGTAWGLLFPGDPHSAAKTAYRDAYLTHRKNGIYAAMFFAAVISAAFTADSVIETLEAGKNEIPGQSRLNEAVEWAIETAPAISNYEEAVKAVSARFPGIPKEHAIVNAPLVIFGVISGKENFTKVISETTFAGYENEYNAALAGSIFGAFFGPENIGKEWYSKFNNKIFTCIRGNRIFTIENVLERFVRSAELKR